MIRFAVVDRCGVECGSMSSKSKQEIMSKVYSIRNLSEQICEVSRLQYSIFYLQLHISTVLQYYPLVCTFTTE